MTSMVWSETEKERGTTMKKIFIDGSAGTTGLNIRERLKNRQEIELLTLEEEKRKDIDARLCMIREADAAFLCLPDAASQEIVQLAGDVDTVLIDTSTAHRTAQGWTYGLPELKGKRKEIAGAKRIANPGCHATGYIVLTAPLTEAGILDPEKTLSFTSLTGYSGGGKRMIAEYEAPERDPLLKAPRMYGLSQHHKHLPEMVTYSGVKKAPVFCPVVGDFYSGMEAIVTFDQAEAQGGGDISDFSGFILKIYEDYYGDSDIIKVRRECDEGGFLSAAAFSGKDVLEISVWGGERRVVLTARYDNLGKGASGAAIQNMNIALGFPETEGLLLGADNP